MMTESGKVDLNAFLELLERLAPARLAEEWDNPGLQVDADCGDIDRIFVSLDPTMDALRRAREAGAQVLFTHHPLIFKPLYRIEDGTYPGNVIHGAIRAGIAVVAAHTNLDVVEGGINDILAGLLGLEGTTVLEEIPGAEGCGPGRVGRLPVSLDLAGLVSELRDRLGVTDAGLSGPQRTHIRTAAVVGGSGGGMIAAAGRRGADCLITGDVGHHHALTAETLGVTVVDAGHYVLEKRAFSVFGSSLADQMAQQGWKVDVMTDGAETSPIRRLSA